jgi:DNA polymerase-1
MISSFLTSLQELADADSRVHCSLNLNTETGRLSSRRPNLQNQPALEKDKYQIRKAFRASEGNNLIVADYGQLELRILASITHCKSMIDAFESGGDFHSRTAIDMFPYVREAVEKGECLLEWDYSKGDPPKPLLKDMFASERRKAKTLNFSIAYGKTAHGLSQDWGVSTKEAEDMLKAWYQARPEVEKWQHEKKQIARDRGITTTLMGRYRQLPEAMGRNRKLVGHAERASINTPIQGGAADIAMMAMIKINDSMKLQKLGWVLLLQIHDEVILEGPEETAKEAFEEVLKCMEHPWVFGLEPTAVPLVVDGSYEHKTWYDAK